MPTTTEDAIARLATRMLRQAAHLRGDREELEEEAKTVWNPTFADRIARLKRAEEDYTRAEKMIRAFPVLFGALKLGQAQTKESLEAIGGCEHEVNICACGVLADLETMDAAITKAEEALS